MSDGYQAFRSSVGAVWLRRDVLRASGADTVDFLQGQLTQDITKIEIGQSAYSWILQPHGKVEAFVHVVRTEETAFVIYVEVGHGESVLERLNRFKMRTNVDFEILPWKVLALRGPNSKAVEYAGDVVRAEADWPGCEGVDLLGADVQVPDGIVLGNANDYEALRIECGVPEMGSELDEKTIPAEAGINDRTISFSKGCYTGQELVARIDSRGGNVPRRLCGVLIDGDELPELGDKIVQSKSAAGSKPYGIVTSVAHSPHFGKPVAMTFVRRDVSVPTDAVVLSDDGTFSCRIVELPLVP